jgi:hypothetical protein
MVSELPDGLFESFWVVCSESHTFSGRFAIYEKACEAAERFAELNPADAFFVMETRCLVRATVTTNRQYAVICDFKEQASEPT